ncbi:hypothetical protein Pcinc_022687 [Petrolisthes cinctipes]|uniref:Ionotropic glutamate receptor C-terminal domain-containing protein n=1 Tax=Petrolisthes cinctipes TaxID=88211 RepID=A0AAE1FD96_PETCI|nr:hypothetical protein Pcinc_022687 [Petrolisthes cinctipes]
MMTTTTMTGQVMMVAQKMMSDIDVGQMMISDIDVGQKMMMSDIDVGQMVGQVLDQYTECHLVLLTTKPTSPVVSTIIRPVRLNPVQQGVTVSASSLSHLWKEPSTTCLTLVLHLNTNINTTILALNLLEEAGLPKFPEVVVVILGRKSDAQTVLLHHTFRNTIHAFYFAVTNPFSEIAVTGLRIKTRTNSHDHFKDLGGHRFQVVTVRYFPYSDFIRHEEEPGADVQFTNSIDDELFTLLSTKLNFTWKVHEQENGAFGVGTEGVFSGMMGELQREEVDIGTPPTITAGRAKIIDFARAYPSVPLVLTSLEPTLLPQHLALVRPFKDEVWGSLLVAAVVWAVLAWVIQQVWARLTDEREFKLSTFMMYGWAALLEQSTPNPFFRNSYQVDFVHVFQMVVGGWLLFCLIVSTCYKGSLISHLSIQSKTKPIETMEELVSMEEGTWNWGMEEALYKGAVIEFFTRHSNPVVKKFAEKFKVVSWQEGLEKVRGGRYSLMGFEDFLTVIIASYFTDDRGRSPFYKSKKGVTVLNDLGWGLRKGLPVSSRFKKLFEHLDESGVINHWIDNKMRHKINTNRKEQQQQSTQQGSILKDEEWNLVLGMEHLQGAFYLLLFGTILAILSLLAENLAHYRP